jgi:hypothetical protein
MATTLLPIDPATSPERANRILMISANLLPEETIAARRAHRARAWVAVMVLVVAGLCGAWFALAYHQKQAAEEKLDFANTTVTDLRKEQQQFSGIVQVQNQTTTLTNQLGAVMANDLDWGALLDTLRSTGASSGIRIDGVNGRLNGADGNGTSSSKALPSTNTATSIGSLVVTGSGPDKQAVAAYADALAKQTTVTNPYVTSVATDDAGVTFSLTVDIAQASLCGRFTTECKSPGGN